MTKDTLGEWPMSDDFELCPELQEIANLIELEEKQAYMNRLAYLIIFNFYYDYMNYIDEQQRKNQH